MVCSTYFSRRFRHCFAAWPAAYVVGVVALALGGCGVDRTGLEDVLVGVGGAPGKGDAAADQIVVGAGGSGGSIAGTGGESGAGGGIVVDGSGGKIGAGGMIGTGGMIAGSGGMIGTGGMIAGTGGMTGAGGMIAGTGGIVGAGGMIAGSGGMIGTGGSPDGGVGDAGTGDAGLGGTPGTGGAGTGGMGIGGAAGVGGAGGAPVCTTPCGPCQRCGANHTCEVDPASTWDVSAIAASINPVDSNVKPPLAPNWDVDNGTEIGGSKPDPFVELDYQSTTNTPIGHTSPIIDTLLPNWGALSGPTAALLNPVNAPVRASDLLAGGKNWSITVYDEDVDAGANGLFGEIICDINGPLTSADFINGGFTRVNVDSCFSVSINLTCRP